jgi:hypothetical protein
MSTKKVTKPEVKIKDLKPVKSVKGGGLSKKSVGVK